MHKLFTATALLLVHTAALSATPSSGTVTIHETELEFTNGPIVGVNPTPFTSDATGLVCDPGVNCDRFDLTVDVPENLSEVFPTAILRLNIDWVSPTGSPVDDYDFYLFDEDGNEIGSSAEFNSGANTSEAIAIGVRGGTRQYRLDIIYFAVVASSYTGTVRLDLGAPSEEADLDAFYADNPPTESFFISPEVDMGNGDSASSRAASIAGGGLGAAGLLLLTLLGLARRHPAR